MHAARDYGVDATGITLSRRQVELAGERIAEAAGLARTCRVEYLDYREVPEDRPCDALVSVGMFEHVGGEMLGAYFQQGGAAPGAGRRVPEPRHRLAGHRPLRHGARASATRTSSPTARPCPSTCRCGRPRSAGFEVRDVESLREHYALTLRHWVRRLEAGHAEALRHVDEAT